MKKFFILAICLFFGFTVSSDLFAATSCTKTYGSGEGSTTVTYTGSMMIFCDSMSVTGIVEQSFDNTLQGSQLVNSSGDMRLETGFRTQVMNWTTNIATLLGLLAIGGIVYGGLLMTLSAGEDEKIKKGKDIVKWSLIGFLALISASALVRIVIEFIYSVSG